MKYLLLLLLLLLVSFQTYSQTKYYIYFKDKAVSQSGVLNKTSSEYMAAEKELTPAAIERRKQVMGENYITFEDLPISQNYIQQVEAAGIKIENKLKWFNAVTAYLNDDEVKQISALPFVEKLERVRVTRIINPNDTQPVPEVKSLLKTEGTTSLNYGRSLKEYSLSDVPAVHDLGINGQGAVIGILDCGFRWKNHPALKNLKIVFEYDYIMKDSVTANQTPAETNLGQDSHGTNCLGLMAGNDPGNLIGPSYGATIMLAKTEDLASGNNADFRSEEDNYVAALQDFEAKGVQITTSSLGYINFINPTFTYTYADMNGNTAITTKGLNLAFNRGVFTLTAAGNEGASLWGVGNGGLGAPADAYNVISVGAIDSLGSIAGFSSRGPTSDGRIKPEVVAMGVSNYVSAPGGGYSTGSGTSYATPITAGIAGMLKSCWPHLTNVQMRKTFIECGSYPTSPDNNTGYGLISAARVIAYPNLQLVGTQYSLNKLFINSAGVNSSTVKINYKMGSGSFQNLVMSYDGTLKYKFTLPSASNGTAIEFYFEYNNSSGVLVREPAVKNYKFNYGSLLIDNNVTTDVKSNPVIPAEYSLSQNYPNPFNPETTINYQLSANSHVTLKVFDILGREVATLVDEIKQPGSYNSKFSIQNTQVASGVYFYQLKTDSFVQTKKMILMK